MGIFHFENIGTVPTFSFRFLRLTLILEQAKLMGSCLKCILFSRPKIILSVLKFSFKKWRENWMKDIDLVIF